MLPWDQAVGASRAPHPRLACGAGLAVLATRAPQQAPPAARQAWCAKPCWRVAPPGAQQACGRPCLPTPRVHLTVGFGGQPRYVPPPPDVIWGTCIHERGVKSHAIYKRTPAEARSTRSALVEARAAAAAAAALAAAAAVWVVFSLVATLPGGGPAEDGSELRSHACGVAKVEARGHAPGVGRIVIVTVTPREVRP